MTISRFHITQSVFSKFNETPLNYLDIPTSSYHGFIDGTFEQAKQLLEEKLSQYTGPFSYVWHTDMPHMYLVRNQVDVKTGKQMMTYSVFSITAETDRTDVSCFLFALSTRSPTQE